MTLTREKAIQILSTRDAHGVLCGYTSGVTEALDMAIEALQNNGFCPNCGVVVRCKDCRHYEKFNYEAPSGYDGWCNTPVIYADGHYTNALHFCSWGERREP